MTEEELMMARTNPEFLGFLEEKEKNAMESKNISELYEVLDSLLILDLDDERINKVYETILMVAFENVQTKLDNHTKFSLENDDFFYIRAFYEHGIEKWSYGNFQGAKELLFVLSQIVEDELLSEAINVKLLACDKEIDLNSFYESTVMHQQTARDEKYGYFILDFKFDTKNYLQSKAKELEEIHSQLKHLLEV
ncbi:MAG: hypothetical protein PHF17_00055 [Arcobacteraceae bacterium]|jgi:hypothetical protein|nr:hypothetical protein [Arcobacteraceae bacterium]